MKISIQELTELENFIDEKVRKEVQRENKDPRTAQLVSEFITLIRTKDKIRAIKRLRELTNFGLRECKDMIESIW